jgi:hypothetical protein
MMMQTRRNQPIVSYNEELMQVREDEIEEEYMDTLYARKPVDASSFPEGDLKWFKANDTLNFGVGKVVVAGLAWILHHFEPQALTYSTNSSPLEDMCPYDAHSKPDNVFPNTAPKNPFPLSITWPM